jgi:hypothetical protein
MNQRLLHKDCYTKIDESKIASQRKGLLRRKSFEESYEVSCETSFEESFEVSCETSYEVSCETSFEESYEISS